MPPDTRKRLSLCLYQCQALKPSAVNPGPTRAEHATPYHGVTRSVAAHFLLAPFRIRGPLRVQPRRRLRLVSRRDLLLLLRVRSMLLPFYSGVC